MFTGLIFELGKIKYINATNNTMYLTVACSDILEGLKIGDSVAINGACQTVTEIFDDSFTVFSSSETSFFSSLIKSYRKSRSSYNYPD